MLDAFAIELFKKIHHGDRIYVLKNTFPLKS